MRLAFALSFVAGLALAQQSGVPSRAASSSSGATSVSANAPLNYSTGQALFCAYPVTAVNGWPSTPPGYAIRYSTNSSAGAGPTPTLGDARTRSVRHAVTTGGAAHSKGGWYTDYSYVARGSTPYIGGFSFWQRFSKITPDFNGTAAWFAGLGNYTSNNTACIRPNLVKQDGVFWQCEDGGVNVNICSWNDAGRTCTDLGADFPCGRHALGDAGLSMFYDTLLTAPPGTSSIGYYAKNLNTGAEASGSLTQHLPAADVLLQWSLEICNGDAGAQTMEMMAGCFNDYSVENGSVPADYDGGSVALDSGIIAYYAFEDGGLSSTADKHASLAASILVNGDAGFMGLGADFSAATGLMQVSDGGLAWTAAQPRTVTMWAQTLDHTRAGRQTLFTNSGSTAGAVITGSLVRSYNSADFTTYTPSNATWTHFAFVYTAPGAVALYVNGEFRQAVTHSYALTLLYFGNDGSNNRWYGYLDEVGVWNRALTPNEVAALYNNGAGFRPL